MYRNSKRKIVIFPFPGAANLKMLCIRAVLQRITSAAGRKQGRGIGAFVEIMKHKSKMRISNDLYEFFAFCIISDRRLIVFSNRGGKQSPRAFEGQRSLFCFACCNK